MFADHLTLWLNCNVNFQSTRPFTAMSIYYIVLNIVVAHMVVALHNGFDPHQFSLSERPPRS